MFRIAEEGLARKTDANRRTIVAGDKYENRLESIRYYYYYYIMRVLWSEPNYLVRTVEFANKLYITVYYTGNNMQIQII